ncbi:MAG: hypothetical protein EA381_03820 [Planctomycetaceae bacterium]|nr:MAG: hypothetical protein EA381_03820 [Planctomycetaceae bacterium]
MKLCRFGTRGVLGAVAAVVAVTGIGVSQGAGAERQATPVGSIRTTEGFRVELLRSAQEGEGSWISMTFDDSGRIVVGLDDRGLARLTLNESTGEADFELLGHTESLRHVRGVLHAHDSLYVSATNSQGIYRLRDLDGDDQYEDQQRLQSLKYDSRYGHGTNQITLGPDGMIYFVIGNDVVFPDPMEPDSPYREPQNDWLLPSQHDMGQDDRVGYIAKVDPEGKSWTVLAGGFRNQVDVAFNRDGEMFTWDADMEWDVGLPWYRPTRLNHVVSGGEYGWRWGTGKWPSWFPDSLPSTLDTGLSSPTGLVFGHTSRWPERYRDALFMADWQFGRILIVDLVPQGATYSASAGWFLDGGPLNVCDLVFGPDGAMYFITGGRGSQSGLYRVTWVGDGGEGAGATSPSDSPVVSTSQPPVAEAVGGDPDRDPVVARALRRQLETFHRQVDPSSLDLIWDHLGDQDPWLRQAARVALENQPLESWRHRLDEAKDLRAVDMALLAMARVGQSAEQPVVLQRLGAKDWSTLSPDDRLLSLRTAQLTLIRHGMPDPDGQSRLLQTLDPLFPQDGFAANWLLQELLVKLRAPGILARSLDLLEQASTQEEQVQYAKTMTQIETGWDRATAGRVIDWLARARGMSGGKLVETAWQRLRADFEARFNPELKAELVMELARLDEPLPAESLTLLPPRPLVQAWKMGDLIDDVLAVDPAQRSAAAGERALAATACLRCHRIGERGSPTGPDLTHVGKRFDGRALLESILEPSRQLDPKYAESSYLLSDGRVVTGRTVGVSKNQLVIEVEPMTARTLSVDRADIEASLPTTRSPMPEGLLDTLTREEILDLIALLRR